MLAIGGSFYFLQKKRQAAEMAAAAAAGSTAAGVAVSGSSSSDGSAEAATAVAAVGKGIVVGPGSAVYEYDEVAAMLESHVDLRRDGDREKKKKKKKKKKKFGGTLLDARQVAHVESLREFTAKSSFGAAGGSNTESTDDDDYLVLDVSHLAGSEEAETEGAGTTFRSWDC